MIMIKPMPKSIEILFRAISYNKNVNHTFEQDKIFQ